MKKNILLLFTLFYSLTYQILFSQTLQIDSLKNELSLSKDKKTKVKVLNNLSYLYGNVNPDSSIHYSTLLIKEAISINDKENIADGYAFIGSAFILKGDFEKSLLNFNKALSFLSIAENELEVANIYTYIGLAYENLFNSSESLNYHTKALKIYEKLKQKEGLSQVYGNMANVYRIEKDFQKALEFYLKSLVIHQEVGNKSGLAIVNYNLGNLYTDSHEEGNKPIGTFEEALKYHQKSLQLSEELGLGIGLCYNYLGMGAIYKAQGKLEKAKEYYQKSLLMAEELHVQRSVAAATGSLGEVYLLNKEYQKAIQFLNTTLKIGQELGSIREILSAYPLLSEAQSALGNYEEAYQNHVIYKKLYDSLFNDENKTKIARIEASYEFEKQKDSIEYQSKTKLLLIEEERKTDKTTLYFIIGGALILIIMLIILYRYFLLKQKANTKLTQLNREKDGILGVVSHDLRTPLNQIKGLVYILKMIPSTEEEQKNYYSLIEQSIENGNRLIADLMLVNQIETDTNKELELSEFSVHDLLDYYLPYYSQLAQRKDIELKIENEISENQMIQTEKLYLTRILDNLLSNAIKFTQSRQTIYFKVTQEKKYILFSIKDEGQGIKKEEIPLLFKKFSKLSATPTGDEESTGLGLSIVKELLQKIKGEIEVESEWQKGSTFFVKIPISIEK